MKFLSISIIGLLISLSVYGQNNAVPTAKATDVQISLSEDSLLNVGMKIIIPADTKINSNRMITLIPVLCGEASTEVLPPVYVYGRRRGIVMERNGRVPEDGSQIFLRKNHTNQTIEYRTTLPYQAWMRKATLHLEEDLCGCGNNVEEKSEQVLAQVVLPDPKPALPAIAYVVPEAEPYKRRTIEGAAFLDFPVNRTEIYPEYRKNPMELAKIISSIDSVPVGDIQHIYIHGYASPEGSYINNTRLAKGRSEALAQYIVEKYQLNDSLFSIESTPEDWVGFKRLVIASDIERKEDILAIIDSHQGADEKEAKLKKLGAPYLYIWKEWFPALRHSDYKIDYIIPSFTAEEARRIFKTQPELLNLRELFEASRLCERNSDEYRSILKTAARLYPDNPDANLNAAAMELESGNLPAARTYMAKADMGTQAARDNMERIILLEGGNK